jgi:hypothetical protein
MAKGKKKKPPIIFIALIVVAVIFLGYKLLGEKALQTKETTKIPEGWQIYKNEEYGFSLAHPPGTEVSRHMLGNPMSIDGFLIYKEDEFDLSVWVYSKDCDEACFQDELVNWWPKARLEGKELTINGNEAFEIYIDDLGKIEKEIYITNSRGLVIYFVFEDLASVDETLPKDQQAVINSLQFSE